MRMRERLLQVVCVVRVVGGPFYSSRGRFPPSLYMETCQTNFRRIRSAFPPKCTWTGACPGSTEPMGRPAPLCRLWPLSFSGTLPGESWCQMVGVRAWLVGLGCQVGLFCMCYAGCDLLRLHLCIIRVFFSFWTCAPENINLPKKTMELG